MRVHCFLRMVQLLISFKPITRRATHRERTGCTMFNMHSFAAELRECFRPIGPDNWDDLIRTTDEMNLEGHRGL